MELFTRLLLDLPKNKFEHLVDFSQKSNYLYSFFDQRILSYFLKMDTCNRSRGTLYIKAMLYDMHRSQPEDFEALLSVMKNKDFLMAFKHFYLIAAFTIKRLFDHSLNNEYSRVSEKVKEHNKQRKKNIQDEASSIIIDTFFTSFSSCDCAHS